MKKQNFITKMKEFFERRDVTFDLKEEEKWFKEAEKIKMKELDDIYKMSNSAYAESKLYKH